MMLRYGALNFVCYKKGMSQVQLTAFDVRALFQLLRTWIPINPRIGRSQTSSVRFYLPRETISFGSVRKLLRITPSLLQYRLGQ